MCNLYTVRLSRDEVAGLMRHRQLIGTNFKDAMNVYPNGEAPVMVLDESGAVQFRDMRWGFPKPPNMGSGYVTNVRASRHPTAQNRPNLLEMSAAGP